MSRLAVMHRLGAWARLDRDLRAWSSEARVCRFAASGQGLAVIAPDAHAALRAAGRRGLVDLASLRCLGRAFAERAFEVFGAPVPSVGDWPWLSDWRWGHAWPPVYFRSCSHYEGRDEPYDVKLPWELARLWFVLPMLQASAIGSDPRLAESALEAVADWERTNPLAYTIGWCPMEASMRSISLVIALDMLRLAGPGSAEVLVPLLRLAAKHGEFIWRTMEYTDVRGNHYAANLVALLLLGLGLRHEYRPAAAWVDHAARRIPREVELQFLPDGVNFEKSLAYHRLVAELFLLAMLALDRDGSPLPDRSKTRLHLASRYSAACTRPDGLTPNVGDNDSARLLAFDDTDPRDHRPLIGLGAAYWRDPVLKETASHLPVAALWLLGEHGLAAWEQTGRETSVEHHYFAAGGAVVVRGEGHFLWVDVGEVGLRGRGGHGHNDLLSFELILAGTPVIVDPGSYVYTADAASRDLFRSTAYHNGVRVDDSEIAPLGGMWRIGNDALPCDVEVRNTGSRTTVRAGHTGYRRLPDPVSHVREIIFARATGAFTCADRLECLSRHKVERFLHLGPGVRPTIGTGGAVLSTQSCRWALHWDGASEARVVPGWVSPGYGERQASTTIVLTDQISGSAELQFRISGEQVSRV